VTARSFVRDLALLADRAAPDAEVDDMLMTLLPGQTAVFTVRTAAALHAADLIGPLVLRSANDLHTERSAPQDCP
jgi:beta-mannosidase